MRRKIISVLFVCPCDRYGLSVAVPGDGRTEIFSNEADGKICSAVLNERRSVKRQQVRVGNKVVYPWIPHLCIILADDNVNFLVVLYYSSRKLYYPVSAVNSYPTIRQSIPGVLLLNCYSYQNLHFLCD